ncbi:hypothetical protein HYFRA_00004323 [Hymenoscyphus fraxineus]|uniref:Uncharacterized protein n=1 Tax=Hymenoscyphus fraxineus TaxID=746836 RepID=A0A9N9KMW3_9HELO|nr:hypothetical protein HYFRA_00004323 [Hymenoscyphus fraxineus]
MAPQTPIQNPQPTAQLQTEQPTTQHSMNLTPTPPAEQQANQKAEEQVHLRGGELCPGRFCFIIPCPLPCHCCII